MFRPARLFHDVDEVIENWYMALRKGDLESALSLWFDEDTITCILPDGVRLTGHNELREGFKDLMSRSLILDTISSTSHSYLGTTFVDSTEAVGFNDGAVEPKFFIHMTIILVQGALGWRIAHMHTSMVDRQLISSPTLTGDHGFH
jgi:ketosteroid isomerase-like protein